MARLTLDTGCPDAVRRVRHLIGDRLGPEGAIVFGEAIANVREHGDGGPAEVHIHSSGFDISNQCGHRVRRHTEKPVGEGGYGRGIMQGLGASVNWSGHVALISWRCP